MDTYGVHMLSNFESCEEFESTKRKVKGCREKADVSIPKIIDTYNKAMGGVDKSDQMKKAYEIDHRYKFKYCMRLFDITLDTMVVNSILVYLELSRKYDRRPMTRLDFVAEVISGLIRIFSTRRRSVSQPSAKRPKVQMPT